MGFRYYVSLFAWLLLQLVSPIWGSEHVDSGWGAGGNGTGACSCNRCQHYSSAGGGYYNSKMITTNGGCSYTVCAAGVYRCLSRECYGCVGCSSYVNGYNLSNFCAIGGCRANANPSWTNSLYICQYLL